MGTFYARIGVANPEVNEFHWVDALVDTGAAYTMLPASLLEQTLNLNPIGDEPFRMADGRIQFYRVGEARFKVGEKERISQVIFGPEARHLLGASALQSLAVIPDTTHHQLIPAPELTL